MKQATIAGGPVVRALQHWLASPRLPFVLAGVAVLLTLPALGIGWQLDDHLHRLIMQERAEAEIAPMEAFSSLKGEPEVTRRWVDRGYLPW